MQGKRPGRPPKPLNPDASNAARLGAEIRARRQAHELTLNALGELTGFSFQHLSQVELAMAPVSVSFVAACDRALGAEGSLLKLLPGVVCERAMWRHERSIARQADLSSALRCAAQHSEGEDVDPTNRRGLLGAGAAAALGGLGVAAAPAAARDIDPELGAHWEQLLSLLGRHDAMFGSHDMLATVQHQLELIADHRRIASGELHNRLLRVESRWAQFAAWLTNDTGQWRSRDAWTNRALQLAREAGYPEMAAFARMRQSQWAAQDLNARRAIAFAEDALRVPGTSAQTRALCALRAALGNALANDATACERHVADARGLVEHANSPAPPWAGEHSVTALRHVRTGEARCWLWMQPSKAIPLYESALREWPRDRTRDGGVHQARLALACAAAGEHERASAEGRKALAIARTTKSGLAARELKRLGQTLGAAND